MRYRTALWYRPKNPLEMRLNMKSRENSPPLNLQSGGCVCPEPQNLSFSEFCPCWNPLLGEERGHKVRSRSQEFDVRFLCAMLKPPKRAHSNQFALWSSLLLKNPVFWSLNVSWRSLIWRHTVSEKRKFCCRCGCLLTNETYCDRFV